MENEPQSSSDKSWTLKRRILLVMGVALGILLLLWVVATVLQVWLDAKDTEVPGGGTHQTIIFYTPDYQEDITKDASYMQLDRKLYYADNATGVTISLDEETMGEYGEATELLGRMIQAVIAGDHEAYNQSFSQEYLAEEGEKGEFTAQKLYQITITRTDSEEVSENGVKYDRYFYTLEYMIYKNNGTFRTDVGSDAIRKQAVVITNREGRPLIDVLSSYTYSY